MYSRIRLLVTGRVQGVGFRASAAHIARELGISGFARNLPSGAVEILAEGEPAALETLKQWARKGPPAAVVAGVEEFELAPGGQMDGFAAR